jgi:hypothetical protein
MLIVLLLLVLACAALFVGKTQKYNTYRFVHVTVSVRPQPGSSYVLPTARRSSYLDWRVFRRTLKRDGPPFWLCWAGCVTWPWLTAAVLMIFRVSMRRAKVNADHVLRGVLYSGDAFLWPALLLTASLWIGVTLTAIGLNNEPFGPWLLPVGVVVAILCVLPVVKLWAAYRRYLRFRHALWTVLASQVIVGLAAAAVVLNVSYYMFS